MKILITGSHFTPAQAVIEELKKHQNIEIVYVGRLHTREGDHTLSVESQVLPGLGIKFIPIVTGRVQRNFSGSFILSILKIPVGFMQSLVILSKEKPDVIVSFGGYLGVPVIIAGWLLSIPIVIHEQTLVSGLANQIGSIFAKKIAVSFAENSDFSKKTVLTGNPIRLDLLVSKQTCDKHLEQFITNAKKEKKPVILVTGGNQGSHIINQTVAEVLDDLTKNAYIIHQTGDSKFKDFESLVNKKDQLKYPKRYWVSKWIESADMGYVYRNVSFVVSRAGMNTLLELAYFGIPALVIPYPYLYKDEQMVNARFFEAKGLVSVLPQSHLTPKTLVDQLSKSLTNLFALKQSAAGATSLVIPDAAKRLALEVMTTK